MSWLKICPLLSTFWCIIATLWGVISFYYYYCDQSGPWSDKLEVMSGAAPPDTPREPQVTCRSSHHAIVQWEEPASNGASITDYRLEMSMADREQDYSTVFHGFSNSYEVKGLVAATPYFFRIQVSAFCNLWFEAELLTYPCIAVGRFFHLNYKKYIK